MKGASSAVVQLEDRLALAQHLFVNSPQNGVLIYPAHGDVDLILIGEAWLRIPYTQLMAVPSTAQLLPYVPPDLVCAKDVTQHDGICTVHCYAL